MERDQTGKMKIVPVKTQQQVDTLARLADEIWHECFAGIITTAQIDYMVEKFLSPGAIQDLTANEGYLYYLLEFDGEPGGFLALQPKDGRMLLSKLYLHQNRRGRGHTHALMAFAEDVARAHGCHTLWLTVNRHNTRACAVYEKTGFTRTRTQQADIGGGFVMDDYIYEKTL